jgi:hypothetical protein
MILYQTRFNNLLVLFSYEFTNHFDINRSIENNIDSTITLTRLMEVGQKYVGTVNYNVADKIKTTIELAKQLLESYWERETWNYIVLFLIKKWRASCSPFPERT